MRINNTSAGPQKSENHFFIVSIITLLLMTVLLYKHNWTSVSTETVGLLKEKLPDFSNTDSVAAKKQAFFDYLKPYIRQENQRIRYDRAFLDSISADMLDNAHHNNANLRKLRRLANRYHYKLNNIQDGLDELRIRIDVIPESLVLAQAANESAWGASRFAREANNLFGQWCFDKGCGLVPKKRDNGAKHEVRLFATPQASIVSYMRNINSHRAYAYLREVRSQLRSARAKLSGIKLAQGLTSYSERGQTYVDEIIAIIRQNRLE